MYFLFSKYYVNGGVGGLLCYMFGCHLLDCLSSLLELDALSKGQLTRVVDDTGAATHVLLPGIGTRLASTASLLLTAKSTADLGAA